MPTQRLANIAFAVITIIACAYFAAVAEGFEAAGLLASSGLPSKFFPQLMLGFVALCAAAAAASYARRTEAERDGDQPVYADAGSARRGLLMLAVSLLCFFVWVKFNYVAMAALLGPLSLLAMGVRARWMYAAVPALTALVYAFFALLLGVPL